MSHLNDTTSSEVLDAALGLVNMTATDPYISKSVTNISKSVTPDHHHRSLEVQDAIASSLIMEVDNYSPKASLPVTKLTLNACIKRIAFLAVHEKVSLRRKYLSRCDYDKITQMVKRQFNIPPNCIINLKKIQRAMLLFDSQPLIVDNNSIEHQTPHRTFEIPRNNFRSPRAWICLVFVAKNTAECYRLVAIMFSINKKRPRPYMFPTFGSHGKAIMLMYCSETLHITQICARVFLLWGCPPLVSFPMFAGDIHET